VERAHGGSREYLHDRENRLVGFDGPAAVTYAYDSSGRMLLRTAPDGTKTKYYYDGINQLLVKEKPVGGVWRTKKVNALKEADIGQIIAHREYTAWSGSTPTAWNDRYYHYDLLGNTTALTDEIGAVAAQYGMEAFGTVKSGGQAGVHLTTKEWDSDSELYYFNARWYSNTHGRWLQVEPFFYEGPNYYQFVLSIPAAAFDSNGLETILMYPSNHPSAEPNFDPNLAFATRRTPMGPVGDIRVNTVETAVDAGHRGSGHIIGGKGIHNLSVKLDPSTRHFKRAADHYQRFPHRPNPYMTKELSLVHVQ